MTLEWVETLVFLSLSSYSSSVPSRILLGPVPKQTLHAWVRICEMAGGYSGGGYDVLVNKYYGFAVCVMFMCDYVETFREEVEYMWKGERWSIARIFFFLSRYLAMMQIPILFSLYIPLTGDPCKAVHTTVLAVTFLTEFFPMAIMLLCLFALYDSKTKYAPVFFGCFGLVIAALLGTMIVYIINVNVPPPHFGACWLIIPPFGERVFLINRALKLSAQSVMCLFAGLRAWKRFREHNTPLMKVIYTGGLYYYCGVAVMAAADIASKYYVPNDPARLKIMNYLGKFGTPILANRLILGMHRHFHKGNTRGNTITEIKFNSSPPVKPEAGISADTRSSDEVRDSWGLQNGEHEAEKSGICRVGTATQSRVDVV